MGDGEASWIGSVMRLALPPVERRTRLWNLRIAQRETDRLALVAADDIPGRSQRVEDSKPAAGRRVIGMAVQAGLGTRAVADRHGDRARVVAGDGDLDV